MNNITTAPKNIIITLKKLFFIYLLFNVKKFIEFPELPVTKFIIATKQIVNQTRTIFSFENPILYW
jgi:hypothetical protein